MFNNVLLKKLPLETGISVVCLSPGVVQTNIVSTSILANFLVVCTLQKKKS